MAQLAEDMRPFAYQVKSCAVHSLGAIEGAKNGVASPDLAVSPTTFESLRERIFQTMEGLRAVVPAELDSLVNMEMRFVFGEITTVYTVENFLLSFSQPNFYFHATVAYSILRMKGIEIGKRDFLGVRRTTA
jgi:hypothetical protein